MSWAWKTGSDGASRCWLWVSGRPNAGCAAGTDAAALAGLANFGLAPFQHGQVATPRWLGYRVQRPEAHCLHHQRDVHARNIGDLWLWDLLFGTFAKPATLDVRVGFRPASPAGCGR